MSETARHELKSEDSSLAVVDALTTLDLGNLSFVQLKRLQKMLQHACNDVEAESRRRADADSEGDTVNVPSPNP